MIAENNHMHEKYKKIELIIVLFYQSSHDKVHFAFIFWNVQLDVWVDSIAASLFENNWLSWQIVAVADNKIQITLLILGRGALYG